MFFRCSLRTFPVKSTCTVSGVVISFRDFHLGGSFTLRSIPVSPPHRILLRTPVSVSACRDSAHGECDIRHWNPPSLFDRWYGRIAASVLPIPVGAINRTFWPSDIFGIASLRFRRFVMHLFTYVRKPGAEYQRTSRSEPVCARLL